MVDPNGNLQDYFGTGVDISGDGNYAVMGAYGDTSYTGAGFVFVRNGTSWDFQQQLTITSAVTTDYAFEQLQISHDGEVIVAGVRGRKVNITSGAVYGSFVIFTRVGTTWTQIQEITGWGLVNPVAHDTFGHCVGISSDGTMIVAGAYGRDTGGTDRGAMFTVPGVFSPIVIDSATQVFTATGSGIIPGSTVQLEGADGTLYSVFNTTTPNAAGTQVTFKMGALGATGGYAVAQQPYKIRVNSTSGLSGTSTTPLIGFAVGWTSPAAGATLTFNINGSTTQTLAGTDGAGGTNRTFSVAPSSTALPSGLQPVTAGGVITGTIAAAGTTSVTFRLTDNGSGQFTDRAINIVGSADLFAFTSHTFTRALGDVRLGPTFDQMKTAYNSTVWYNTTAWFNQVSGKQGFQLWTVPKTGTYRITAKGGQGARTAGNGSYSNSPGNGANIRTDIAFTMGTKIVIIVGQAGEFPTGSNKSNSGGGGGGATWILKENFTTVSDQVYMVAGGGGGAGTPTQNNMNGGHANGASQGILGGGGAAAGTAAAGGAGWTGNGIASMSFGNGNSPGIRPAAGAMGGASGYVTAGYESTGGFGGGGGNGADHSGGGAGATGGAGSSSHNTSSYGGTSYIITTATNRTFTGTHTAYEGSVYIQAPGTF